MFPHQIYDTLRGMTQTCITRHRMYAYERLKITWVYVRLGIRKCISLVNVGEEISSNCLTK